MIVAVVVSAIIAGNYITDLAVFSFCWTSNFDRICCSNNANHLKNVD